MPRGIPRLFQLKGTVQHYAWGGYDFIPRLLGIRNNERQPYAEYWLGAHPKATSQLLMPDGNWVPLDQFITGSREEILGRRAGEKSGNLPYLFKVLDVRNMLSIQVHPSRQQAVKGFERENAAGVPLDAPHRNYKDINHKPEVMVALSEFWLLHGFRQEHQLRKVLEEVPEFRPLQPYFAKGGWLELYREVMEMDDQEVKKILQPLLARIVPVYLEGRLHKDNPGFWAARAVTSGICRLDSPDRGIFSIYFFNLVRLLPGEGIFQAAGVPHAYLEGQNMELMANSDNVLRGGLTPKHVEVPELLKHIRFTETVPDILMGYCRENGLEKVYDCPVPDFEISCLQLHSNEKYKAVSESADILIVLSGSVHVNGSRKLDLHQGESMIAFSGESYEITRHEEAVLYKATTPQDSH